MKPSLDIMDTKNKRKSKKTNFQQEKEGISDSDTFISVIYRSTMKTSAEGVLVLF